MLHVGTEVVGEKIHGEKIPLTIKSFLTSQCRHQGLSSTPIKTTYTGTKN